MHEKNAKNDQQAENELRMVKIRALRGVYYSLSITLFIVQVI